MVSEIVRFARYVLITVPGWVLVCAAPTLALALVILVIQVVTQPPISERAQVQRDLLNAEARGDWAVE